ncbi:hypothetical protein F5884DRAFT_745490 [Xylogone sp. PMI_703]|nr:hypothetical protein F5884DRAFT_745490 [Xylogone sp. PMI_703]
MLRSSPFSQSLPRSPDPKIKAQRPIPLNELIEPTPCEVYGCTTFAVRSMDGVKVCRRHEVEPRHKPTPTQKQGVAMKTATLPKVNKKAKLYTVKLEHDSQTLKRKRSSGLPKTVTSSETSKDVGESVLSRVPSTATMTAEVGSNNANRAASNIQRLCEQPETPEYEPPPPTLDNSPSPWLSVVENPESQLAEEARANRESSTIYVDVPRQRTSQNEASRKDNKKQSKEIVGEHLSPARKALPTISPPESSAPRTSPHGSTSGILATPPIEESTHELIEENLASRNIGSSKLTKLDVKPEHFEDGPSHNSSRPLCSPVESALVGNEKEIVSIIAENDIPASTAESIEVTPKAKRVAFDESVLDRYLSMQTQTALSGGLNSSSSLLGQPWGHIDPREAWPKEANPDWLVEKLKEIEARPKKKANFGKVLTVQNVKERRESGWHIHQNKALPARDYQGYGHIEELFAVKGIDELEPSVRNGVLVMSEKAFDESGKRRKKNSVKVFPVS